MVFAVGPATIGAPPSGCEGTLFIRRPTRLLLCSPHPGRQTNKTRGRGASLVVVLTSRDVDRVAPARNRRAWLARVSRIGLMRCLCACACPVLLFSVCGTVGFEQEEWGEGGRRWPGATGQFYTNGRRRGEGRNIEREVGAAKEGQQQQSYTASLSSFFFFLISVGCHASCGVPGGVAKNVGETRTANVSSRPHPLSRS